jgi:predicted transcriptional regulator
MTKTVRVNTTLDDDLLERIDAFASERREDRSTAIRQLVDIALRELSKRDALNAYRQGRLTLREFAEALNLGVWAAHDFLLAEGVAIAQGTGRETRAAMQRLMPTVAGHKRRRPAGLRRGRGPANQSP